MLWFREGLYQSLKTLTPQEEFSPSPGLTPGRPAPTAMEDAALGAICPTHALREQERLVEIDYARCIQCHFCHQRTPGMNWEAGYHWAEMKSPGLPAPFRHSLQVRVIDAGDCGACLNEIHQLASPVYSLHRFGISFTPAPRDADVLMVTGPVTVSIKEALEEAFGAVPEPKRVMAIGTCALSGGIFASSFAVAGPVDQVIPVDIEIPGCPPPPLAILDGCRLIMGVRSKYPIKEG